MKITPALESEIRTVMQSYWDSYFEGNLEKWASFLPEDYRNIGTTQEEIWTSKQDILDYTIRMQDQMVGMADFRNKTIEIMSYDPYLMVHELGDLHVKTDKGWAFYAQFRLSSLLLNASDGWKILHQHGSFPDHKAAEGEAFGFEAVKAENERLKKAVEERTAELSRSLEHLKSTQAQLIQSEKMASLGELTAGIAHEIKNPLNFVNNFSEVSGELIEEAQQEIDKGDLEEIKFILQDLKDNLSKINHHGKRAGSIVKGMLEHSRKSEGKKEITDLNQLADECLRLSFHGLRAKDKSFSAEFKTEFDPDLPKVEVVTQDIGRVILNLINNAFYAVNEKATLQKIQGDHEYKPQVIVSTKKSENGVEISVLDNGSGIPNSIKEKIFQPFFTTKPTGSGTGLGLSLSYDIVKAHGGELWVTSKEGEGTEFSLRLQNTSLQ